MRTQLAQLLASLWLGGLVAVAFAVVPALFLHFDDPTLAGPMAAKLFTGVCYATGLVTVSLLILRHRQPSDSLHLPMWGVMSALLAAAVQEGVVAHFIVTARSTGGDLALWHRLGSALVLVQTLAAVHTWWRLHPKHP